MLYRSTLSSPEHPQIVYPVYLLQAQFYTCSKICKCVQLLHRSTRQENTKLHRLEIHRLLLQRLTAQLQQKHTKMYLEQKGYYGDAGCQNEISTLNKAAKNF